MNLRLILTSLIALPVALSACRTPHDSKQDAQLRATQSAAEAATRNTSTQSQELLRLAQENAILNSNMRDLTGRITSISQQQQQLDQAVRNLRSALDAEQKARIDDSGRVMSSVNGMSGKINQVVDQVNQLNTAVRQVAAQPKYTPPAASTASAKEYYQHKVEAGQTIGAIAKAYGVTTSEIKSANNLKSDSLRIGQTLSIPKKK